jgi:hypothetical protein
MDSSKSFAYAKITIGSLLAVNLALITYAFIAGQIFPEGAEILKYVWGQYTFVDLYAMFLLFIGWIWFRTANMGMSILFTILTLFLGSIFAYAYVLAILMTVNDDWEVFWMGSTARNLKMNKNLDQNLSSSFGTVSQN